MKIALAPMEGFVDANLRDVLTRVGGIDWCVTEFIRVSDGAVLPEACIRRFAPELANGAKTPAGTEMRVQLLGCDPACMADNAAHICTLGAPAIDLNFGCPSKAVNKRRGGAVLLKEPELMYRIVREVRRAVPAHIPVTTKMRLGYDSTDSAIPCAQALEDGGASMIVVHARTKVDGYKPPAHWEWIPRVQGAVKTPIYANGEIWSVEDWRRCREVSGAQDFMLGRGLVARPDLARQIVAAHEGREIAPMTWVDVLPLVQQFWRRERARLIPRQAPGRLKQWLVWLAQAYPEAGALWPQIRKEADCLKIDSLLGVNDLDASGAVRREYALVA
jgi:tRNA-dihydrouridine synthase C